MNKIAADRLLMDLIFGEDAGVPDGVRFPPGIACIATGYWYDGWDFRLKYTVYLNDTTTDGYWKALIRQDGYASGPWRFTWKEFSTPDDEGTEIYTGDYNDLPLPVRDEITRVMGLINIPYVPY